MSVHNVVINTKKKYYKRRKIEGKIEYKLIRIRSDITSFTDNTFLLIARLYAGLDKFAIGDNFSNIIT